MRGEEARLSENSQDMEKVKQQHYIQEDKVWSFFFFQKQNFEFVLELSGMLLMQFCTFKEHAP